MSETPQPLIDARDLTRRDREGNALLDSVSLSVAAGERWAVTGDSGAGKTLLLRSLALLDPIGGEISWKRRVVAHGDVPEYRSHVVYLSQAAAMATGTVEDNLRIPFALKRYADLFYDGDAIAVQLDQLSKRNGFLQRRDSELSGGERQIVALLRVLQLHPSVLLLDEATAALDPVTELVVEALVAEWQAAASDERAVVWVSHDEAQRRRVADLELRLHEGRAVEVAS